MTTVDRLKLRTILTSSAVTFVAIALLGTATAFAICIPTVYSVTSSAPPPIGNWTDTSGAVWTPAGGFPGCSPGDVAQDLNAAPTTLIINSAVPNPIIALNLACNGCVIEIQSGGSLTLAGSGSIGSGATLRVNGGTLTIANAGNLTLQNGSTLQVSSGMVDIQTGGHVTLNSFNTLSGGTIQLSGGTLTELAALALQSGATLSLDGGTIDGIGLINSSGAVNGNSGTTTISAQFNTLAGSAGVSVLGGTIDLSGGGTGDAPFAISSGGTLDFPAGSYTMTTGGVVSGDGTLAVTGGTLSIGGVTSPGVFSLTAGTLTGAGFLSIRNAFYWDGGTITGSGGAELAGTGSGVLSGASGAMLLDGRTFNNYGYIAYPATANELHLTNNAAFNTYGTFDFQGDGDIIAAGPSSVGIFPNGLMEKNSGSGVSVIQPSTTNDSTVYVSSGTIDFAGNGSHSGSFVADNDGFNPVGTIAFSAANSGINGALFGSGDFRFPSGVAEYDGSFFAVGGRTWITGGTLTLDSNAFTTDFTFDSGTIELFADFDMAGTGTWSGGTMRYDDGTFYVDPGATLTIDSANGVTTLDTAVIDNEGTVNYTATGTVPAGSSRKPIRALSVSGYLELRNNSTIFNDGLFDIQTDSPIVSTTGFIIGDSVKGAKSRRQAVAAAALKPVVTARGRVITHRARTMGKHAAECFCSVNDIENFVTLQKSTATGTTDFGPSFGNSGDMKALNGTLNFQSDYFQDSGATTLGPGNIQVAIPMDVEGGIIDGTGTITGDVDNYGEVKPGTSTTIGTINITGNYNSGATTSAVTIKIAGPAAGQFDQLNVTGTATLDGTFNGSFINGYAPATGSVTWPVITYASRTGAFATVNVPAYSGGTVTYAYNPTSFDLTAVTPATANLSIAMNGPSTVNAGAPLSYTIDVSSLGPDPTGGIITVVDTLPAGFSGPVTGTGTGWSCGAPSGGTITCTNPGPLTNGNSLPTLTIAMTAPVASGNVTNSATVSNSISDPVASNNTASVTTNVGPQANLSIMKTVTSPAPVNPGQNIVYSIVVQNNGPSAAATPAVTDNTPAGLVFVSASGGGCTSFPCTLPTLNAGQSVTITATYNVPSNYSGGAITNTAHVSSPTNDPNIADNDSTAITSVGAAADVAITKSGPSSTNVGQAITYTITVSNFGPAGATGVTVSDPTPAGLTPVSVSGGGCTTFPCTIGALAVGPPVTITAMYNVPANYSGPSPIVNTATVSSASDPNSSNNSSSVSTAISAQADLGVTKSGPASAVVGTAVSYTITVTNFGALAAANSFVADPTPAGLTPAGVSGGGCSSFPCALGTINPGQSIVITAAYNVPANYAGSSISNTASVSTSSPEANTSNNSATAVTPISSVGIADLSVTTSGPSTAPANGFLDFNLLVVNNGPSAATNVVITNPTPSGLQFLSANGACTTFPCVVSSLAVGQFASVTGHYRVIAPSGSVTDAGSVSGSETDPVPANNSSSATVSITAANSCPQPPLQTSPATGTTVTSPVTFIWTPVPNATGYVLSITTGGVTQSLPPTTATSSTQPLGNGAYTWTVRALGTSGCPDATTLPSAFNVCNNPIAPIASVVGATTTGQTYVVDWTPTEGTTLYEVQESANAAFTAPVSTTTGGTSMSFTKSVQNATTFYYRVRSIAGCSQVASPFSAAAPIVILSVPPLGTVNINIPVPSGSKQPVTFPLHVDGIPNVTTSFFATVDKPWLAVTPTSGIMPPEGINFTISADPSALQDGTWTGTVIIVFGSNGVSGKTALDVAPKTSIPVSISLTTPVTPATLTGPSATAVVIPSVGHLAGLGSQWQSDIRIANITALSKKVQLTFNQGSATSQAVKQTTISIDPGATTALDDIVRNWFGTGAMGDSSNGVLTVQPLDLAGKPDLSIVKSTVASSRTFNASAAGTLGQFIPAVPLANFISKAPGSASILTLQQIAQTDNFHTNLGLVEATGKAASVLVSVFNGAGSKILDIPVGLAAGEQKQLNSFLADKGVTLTNGHIEVSATGGDGKVTAYASVVDSRSSDPLLVTGVPIGGTGASRFVIPGVASLDTGASWRSDVRIFNSSTAPQTATMTLYPTGNPTASVSRDTTIQPGEVKALDDIVHSTFNLTNAGGALHVTTAVSTPLVVTARTFNDTPGGTLGQFLQAVTIADSVGLGERSLQLLQMEDSPRYRTNLGLAETTGKPATVEVTVILPDSKVAPKVSIPLAAFEYRQFAIISSLGLGNTYNARISVRVIDGQGKVTAYGSVIDQKTQDPTFVPGQ